MNTQPFSDLRARAINAAALESVNAKPLDGPRWLTEISLLDGGIWQVDFLMDGKTAKRRLYAEAEEHELLHDCDRWRLAMPLSFDGEPESAQP